MTPYLVSSGATLDILGGMTTIDGPLAKFIAQRSEDLGLRQIDLAARSGLTKSEINSIFQGRVLLPGPEKRRALATALRVRHVDLLIAAGELLPEEVASLAIAPVAFPETSPAAKVVEILKELPDDFAEWVLNTAVYAERKARGERDEDGEVVIRVGGNRRSG